MPVSVSYPQYITDENGEKTGVILSIDAYNELMEDLSDLATIAERRNEKTVSHEELVSELKTDGYI